MFQIPDPKEQLVAIMKQDLRAGNDNDFGWKFTIKVKMETYISRRAEPTRAV